MSSLLERKAAELESTNRRRAGGDTLDPELQPFHVVDALDLVRQPFIEPAFVVRPLFPERAIVLVSGDVGSLKTAFLIHCALCIAARRPIAGRFPVASGEQCVLYLNGEMGGDRTPTYVQHARAGLGVDPLPGRFVFEGVGGVATFRYGESPELRRRLEVTLDTMRPSVVIFDTQRALFDFDENDAAAVRVTFRWLRELAERFGTCIVVVHHLRKIGAVSNNERERVAGSRDLIASVDVHLAVKSRGGRPMHALQLEKTRAPVQGATAGTEWPIDARLDMSTTPPASLIVANEPTHAAATISTEDAVDELRARLEAEGPLTISEMGASKGNAKRAYESLRDAGELVEVGKDGRKLVFGLAGLHEPAELGLEARSSADRVRDRTRGKPNSDGRLNAVNGRPWSDREGQSGHDGGQPTEGLTPTSEPPTEDERGQRSYICSDRVRDRTRSQEPDEVPFDGDEGGW
jgi:hypothetical protein